MSEVAENHIHLELEARVAILFERGELKYIAPRLLKVPLRDSTQPQQQGVAADELASPTLV